MPVPRWGSPVGVGLVCGAVVGYVVGLQQGGMDRGSKAESAPIRHGLEAATSKVGTVGGSSPVAEAIDDSESSPSPNPDPPAPIRTPSRSDRESARGQGIRFAIEFPEDGLDEVQLVVVRVAEGEDAKQALERLDLLRRRPDSRQERVGVDRSSLDMALHRPGTYAAGLRRDEGHPLLDFDVVELSPSQWGRCSLAVPGFDPQRTLRVTATGPGHEPAKAHSWRLWVEDSTASRLGSLRILSSQKGPGEYVLAFDDWGPDAAISDWDRWPDGRVCRLEARDSRWGSTEVLLSEGQRSARLVFGEPAELEVICSNLPADRSSICVRVHSLDRDTTTAWTDRPDGLGRCRFTAIRPGSYGITIQVVLSAPFRTVDQPTLPIELVTGRQEVRVDLPVLHDLRLRCAGLGSRQYPAIRLSGPAPELFPLLQDEEIMTFPGLPEGEYLVVGPGDIGQMLVRVPAAEVVEFDPRPADTLEVAHVAPGGVLDRAGFQVGDRWLAVDGVESSTLAGLQEAIVRASLGSRMDVTVWRAGERRELVVPGEPFRWREDLGGVLVKALRPR